jgi:predicted DNA-binding ribbon-helix-helix protein
MKSPVVKRSIVVAGHKTSVSLEEAFWNGMKEISGLREMTLSELVGEIDNNRQQGNLSSAIRLFVLDYFKSRATNGGSGSGGGEPRRGADSFGAHSGQTALT